MPAQLGFAEYLTSGGYDRHLRQLRHALFVQQNEFMQAVIQHFPAGTRATRPNGGYFLWLELPGAVDALAIQCEALALGISVAPGPLFSAQKGFTNCLRLNYGHLWDARTANAVEVLGKLVATRAAA